MFIKKICLISALLTNSSAFAMHEDLNDEKLSLSINQALRASKSISDESTSSCGIKKINSDLYVAKFKSLYFAIEKVDNKNINFWKSFVDAQITKATTRLSIPTRYNRDLSTVNDGAAFFKEAVLKYDDHQMWVAYISEAEVDDFALNLWSNDALLEKPIIMAMTVSSGESLPYTTHMGIFKTVLYTCKPKENYKNLSPLLHSFAAKASENYMFEKDTNKIYMMTTPADKMREILIRILPDSSYHIGTKSEFISFKEADQKDINILEETSIERILLENDKEKIKEYFPKGIHQAKEPPLDIKNGEWTLTLKTGETISIKPTEVNKKQNKHNVPWVTVDLNTLGLLYPW